MSRKRAVVPRVPTAHTAHPVLIQPDAHGSGVNAARAATTAPTSGGRPDDHDAEDSGKPLKGVVVLTARGHRGRQGDGIVTKPPTVRRVRTFR